MPAPTRTKDPEAEVHGLVARIRQRMEDEKLVLVLSGGAPHSPLMAGAVAALNEKMGGTAGTSFDAIYTAGGGALVGLLLVAPRSGNPHEALHGLLKMGIADPIYRRFPLGYKAFVKPGPFVPLFMQYARIFKAGSRHLPRFRAAVTALLKAWGGPTVAVRPRHGAFHQDDPDQRLFEDWVDLVFTALAPTTLAPWSTGLCEPLPFLEELVDFEALHDPQKVSGNFYVNAYNLTKGYPQLFTKDKITPARVRAALAFPFIYPPARIDGDFYTEGAQHDPVVLPHGPDPHVALSAQDPAAMRWFRLVKRIYTEHLVAQRQARALSADGDAPTPAIVYIDILGGLGDMLLRPAQSLWDAYGLSIITPIVALARKDLEHFKTVDQKQTFLGGYRLLEMAFTFPDRNRRILDWSYSNLCELWDIGYAAGLTFWNDNRDTIVPLMRRPGRRRTYASRASRSRGRRGSRSR
jgi:NTE family protein